MLVALILGACLLINVHGQRIAGGNPADIQEFPFTVSLLTNNGQGLFRYGCGGTILTNNAILSVASCFYSQADLHPASWWQARVGSALSNSGGTIYRISRINPHPDFSTTTFANDIAILRTTLAMALVPGFVEAARISGSAYTFATNQQVRAIGWGATSYQNPTPSEELREVHIWTINQTTCANRWSAEGFTVTANMVCVGWLDVGVRGQCAGDVGSPILDISGGFVVGVFSRGKDCDQGWYPAVNTRVGPYVQWIASVAY